MSGIEIRQGQALRSKSSDANLLLIDKTGLLSIYTASGKEKILSDEGSDIVQAFSSGPALIINGILRTGLDESVIGVVALAQAGDGCYYVLYSSDATLSQAANILYAQGVTNAYVLASGDDACIYTCFGISQSKPVSNIVYFATAAGL